MDNHVDTIIDELYDMLQNARSVPMSAEKCIVNREQILDMLDEISKSLPEDIKSAKTIISSRNELIAQAQKEADSTISTAKKKAEATLASADTEADKVRSNARAEAESIIKNAKQKAQEMVTKEAVYQETQRQCQEMVDQANAKINELRKVSIQYMNDSLKKTEDTVAESLREIRETRAKLNAMTGEKKKIGNEKQANKQAKIMELADSYI